MSTMTITSPAHIAGSSYLENVGTAARNLLAALFAVRPQTRAARKTDGASLTDLYRMAASYDSVMPNLAQELRTIALRA